MMKERVMAIVIGGLMILSAAGFAASGHFIANPNQHNDQNTLQLDSNIVDRPLSTQERLAILQAGITVIQHVYPNSCGECREDALTLTSLANRYRNFVILETYASEDTLLHRSQLVSPRGTIIELGNLTLTDEELFDLFCDNAAVAPRECILRQVFGNQSEQAQGQEQSSPTPPTPPNLGAGTGGDHMMG